MLIGAHVSPSGGPANAVGRGVEKGADAIQIFNQNPRQWKPTVYNDEQVADFHDAMEHSRVKALLIHAVYLLNCASEDKEIQDKSLASLVQSLTVGKGMDKAALGALAVGSPKVQAFLAGAAPKKVIVVPDRLVNIVA